MKMTGNTVLITGGGSGIGMAFAERFAMNGNKVIICGRREKVLQDAKNKIPSLEIRKCDLVLEQERIALFDWVTSNYPEVNVLINNAGILRRVNIMQAAAMTDWTNFKSEIDINFEAPIHLCMLFANYFSKRQSAAIINITSGLAFTPLAVTPIYSATKAAMHSFTMSLRYQLSETSIDVIEVVPPAVDTELNGAWLKTQIEPLDKFADSVFRDIQNNVTEIGYTTSQNRLRMSRDDIDQYAEKMYLAMKSSIE